MLFQRRVAAIYDEIALTAGWVVVDATTSLRAQQRLVRQTVEALLEGVLTGVS